MFVASTLIFMLDLTLIFLTLIEPSCIFPAVLILLHNTARNSAWPDSMADSDRSRSPVPGRNRSEPRGPVQPVRQELPFFPRWCGPMQAAVWHSQQMSRPQFRPQFNMQQSGAYMPNRSMNQNPSILPGTWPNPRFPPAPPSSPPPTLAYYPVPPRHATPPCSPTLPCPQTQPVSPSTPSVPSSQPRRLTSTGVQEVIRPLTTTGLMASISTLIGKMTKTTTTTRRSTAWPSHEAFVNQPSHKNWISKDVILCSSQWRPCYISRPTTFGFASWLMVVNSTWSLQETSQQLFSWLNSWRSSETRAWIWTKSLPVEPDKTAKFWTRPTIPSMQHNRSPISSTAGFRHAAWAHPTQKPAGATASKTRRGHGRTVHTRHDGPFGFKPCFNTHPSSSHEELPKSSTSCTTRLWSIFLAGWHHHPEPVASSTYATNSCRSGLQQMAQGPQLVRTQEKGPHWEHRQNRRMERVAVMMGIPVSLLGKNYDALNLLRVMTAAISLTNWLAPHLRKKLKHKVLQSHLQILHAMILAIYLLTPFTMTHSIHLFQGFRIIQTRMMVLAILHGLRPNPKLKSILEGCADLKHLWGTTLHTHNSRQRV